MNRFENGFHSFKKSIVGLTRNKIDEFELKDIIINFHHSIEVLFKHILFNKNSLFIYNDIDKLFEDKFNMKLENKNNKEHFTTTFDKTIKRVIVLCEEDMDTYTYNRFKNLVAFRNRLTHDEIDLIKEEVEQLIISLLPTVIMILRKHLPKEDKDEFIGFVDNKEIKTKLRELYTFNDKWRIITIVKLLTMYKSIGDSANSLDDKNLIKKMASLLGCETNEDEIGIEFYEREHLLEIDYLKQEICDYIAFYNIRMRKLVEDNEINKLMKENKIIEDICNQYINKMICNVLELININKENLNYISVDEINTNNLFYGKLLIEKLGVYQILFHIRKTVEGYIKICDKRKKVNEILKRIYLNKEESINAYDIYNIVTGWFRDEKWYDVDSKCIPKDIEELFIKNGDLNTSIEDKVYSEIYCGDFFNDFIGKFGEWSSIDCIDYEQIEGIIAIIKDNNEDNGYMLILEVDATAKTYSDGDYYNNGKIYTYVTVSGQANEDKNFDVDSIEYLGEREYFNYISFK